MLDSSYFSFNLIFYYLFNYTDFLFSKLVKVGYFYYFFFKNDCFWTLNNIIDRYFYIESFLTIQEGIVFLQIWDDFFLCFFGYKNTVTSLNNNWFEYLFERFYDKYLNLVSVNLNNPNDLIQGT